MTFYSFGASKQMVGLGFRPSEFILEKVDGAVLNKGGPKPRSPCMLTLNPKPKILNPKP